MLLPEVKTLDGYRRIYRDEAVWRPAMRVICGRHGLDATLLAFAPPGSHVVFGCGPGLYIKLFAPLWRRDYVPEKLVLGKLSGQSDWLVPHLVAEGEVEGWPYLIVTAVEGVPRALVLVSKGPRYGEGSLCFSYRGRSCLHPSSLSRFQTQNKRLCRPALWAIRSRSTSHCPMAMRRRAGTTRSCTCWTPTSFSGW